VFVAGELPSKEALYVWPPQATPTYEARQETTLKLHKINSIQKQILQWPKSKPDSFLKHVPSVIHVGANTMQERDSYDKLGLDAIWIKPIPHIFFSKLQANLSPHPKQRTISACNRPTWRGEKIHVTNNDGASSSILKLKDHKDI